MSLVCVSVFERAVALVFGWRVGWRVDYSELRLTVYP